MSLLDSEIEVIDKVSIKDLIIEWLKKYKITDYKINDDLTIDANGRVDLNGYPEPQLPDYIQFNKVNGDFDISYSQIKTLKGCPKIVYNGFNCSHCYLLKNLKHGPKEVNHNFDCSFCVNLKSFKNKFKIINGNLYCIHCPDLVYYEDEYEIINGQYYII